MKKQLITLLVLVILSACSTGNWGWDKNNSGNEQSAPVQKTQATQSQTITNPQLKTPNTKVVTAPTAGFTGYHEGVYFVNGKPRNNAPGSGVPIFEHPAREHQRKLQEQRSCRFAWQCR